MFLAVILQSTTLTEKSETVFPRPMWVIPKVSLQRCENFHQKNKNINLKLRSFLSFFFVSWRRTKFPNNPRIYKQGNCTVKYKILLREVRYFMDKNNLLFSHNNIGKQYTFFI